MLRHRQDAVIDVLVVGHGVDLGVEVCVPVLQELLVDVRVERDFELPKFLA